MLTLNFEIVDVAVEGLQRDRLHGDQEVAPRVAKQLRRPVLD